MSTFPPSIGRDIRLAGASGASTASFVADPAFPDVTAENLWQQWLRFILKGEVPLGHRVFCGVTVPDSSVFAVCAAAAARMNVGVADDDTADTLSNRCIDTGGSPWSDP